MMIARLKGVIDEVGLDGVLIDVGGVGYPVLVSTPTRAALPRGEPATLLVETQIREDSVVYYGFLERAERDWFRQLTTVQGVGGKVALNILSVLGPRQLAQAILAEDRAALSRAEGVGAKLAARLVTELKEKAGGWQAAAGPVLPAGPVAASGGPAERSLADAIAALEGLGFKRLEAQTAVAAAARRLGAGASVNELVLSGLKEFAP